MSVDATLLQSLVEMGFAQPDAKAALLAVGSVNLDTALQHLLSGGEAPPADAPSLAAEEFKCVLVVVEELAMSPGKVAAQAAHAAVGHYKHLAAHNATWLAAWEAGGEKTVVCSVPTAVQARDLQRQGDALGLVMHAVHDAGRTEVAPGSFTVLAVGGPASLVDRVTGALRLLR